MKKIQKTLKKISLFVGAFVVIYLFLGFLSWVYFDYLLQSMLIDPDTDVIKLKFAEVDVSNERLKDMIEINFYISLLLALAYIIFEGREKHKIDK